MGAVPCLRGFVGIQVSQGLKDATASHWPVSIPPKYPRGELEHQDRLRSLLPGRDLLIMTTS